MRDRVGVRPATRLLLAAVALILLGAPAANAATPAADTWTATTTTGPWASTTAAVTRAAPSPAGEQIYAKPVSSRLNPTGKVITMPVPFKDDGQTLGEVIIRINPDDTVMIPKAALVDKLTPILDKAALARLHGLADSNGQLTIADLKAAGFNISFDPGQLELRFSPNADQRPLGELSLSRRNSGPPWPKPVAPTPSLRRQPPWPGHAVSEPRSRHG